MARRIQAGAAWLAPSSGSIGGGAVGLLDTLKKTAISVVNNVGPLRDYVSKRSINSYAYRTPPRPRSISMAADYTTWPGLVDKRFSGRHLRRASGNDVPHQPDIEVVHALFARTEFRPARDTNLLFPFFAQWFTDSFLRTKWEEGESRFFRENESNHEIDLCSIYGMSEVQTTMLRAGQDGRLASQTINGEEWPSALFEEEDGVLALAPRFRRVAEVDEDAPAKAGLYSPGNFRRVVGKWTPDQQRQAFAVGLEHGNSTMANIVMNTLFLREHNRTAALLHAAHPDWNDERLFQTARNVTIVVLLNIVVGDYIVHIAPIDVHLQAKPGMAEKERWYRNNWMAVEFALLYRWHDLIPDSFVLAGETYDARRMLMSHQLVTEAGLDRVLLDAAGQHAGRIGLGNTAAFLLERDGPNVKRLSLAMARACALPSFNAYRRYYGLPPITSFEKLTGGDKALAGRLASIYGHVDRLEWFVGLFAESYGGASMMGELMVTMVANDAFTQALTNPLLAEHVHNAETFGEAGLEVIQTTRTLADVIVRNTGIRETEKVRFTI